MTLFQDLKSDFRRHGSSLRNLAFWAVATYRFGVWANTLPDPFRWLGGKIYGALSLWVEIATGISLNREARIGKGLHLVHAGNIKVHPSAIIGDRVGIMQDVTIGTGGDREGTPVIGNDVFIGAGAKVLGAVSVGDRARIAANSLVITNVPPDTTAIGVPAKILHYTGRRSQGPAVPGPSRPTRPARAAATGSGLSPRDGATLVGIAAVGPAVPPAVRRDPEPAFDAHRGRTLVDGSPPPVGPVSVRGRS